MKIRVAMDLVRLRQLHFLRTKEGPFSSILQSDFSETLRKGYRLAQINGVGFTWFFLDPQWEKKYFQRSTSDFVECEFQVRHTNDVPINIALIDS